MAVRQNPAQFTVPKKTVVRFSSCILNSLYSSAAPFLYLNLSFAWRTRCAADPRHILCQRRPTSVLMGISLYGTDCPIPKLNGPAIIIHEFSPIDHELLEGIALLMSLLHPQGLFLGHYRSITTLRNHSHRISMTNGCSLFRKS